MRRVRFPGFGGLRSWSLAAAVVALIGLASSGLAQEKVLPSAQLLNPDGTRWVSYEPFDGYPPAGVKTEVTFHLGVSRGTAPAKTVVVPEIGRTIDRISWIDDRFVLVAADFASSILDFETGTVAGQVYGLDFAVSPQADRIAFHHGAIPRYFGSDGPPESQVGLWYRQPSEGREVRWSRMGVYPKIYLTPEVDYGRQPPPEQRHLVTSGFSWSPSGRRLAFTEEHGGGHWLVVLDVGDALRLSVPAVRFPLPEAVHDVAALGWAAEEAAVQVRTSQEVLRFRLGSGSKAREPAAASTGP